MGQIWSEIEYWSQANFFPDTNCQTCFCFLFRWIRAKYSPNFNINQFPLIHSHHNCYMAQYKQITSITWALFNEHKRFPHRLFCNPIKIVHLKKNLYRRINWGVQKKSSYSAVRVGSCRPDQGDPNWWTIRSLWVPFGSVHLRGSGRRGGSTPKARE